MELKDRTMEELTRRGMYLKQVKDNAEAELKTINAEIVKRIDFGTSKTKTDIIGDVKIVAKKNTKEDWDNDKLDLIYRNHPTAASCVNLKYSPLKKEILKQRDEIRDLFNSALTTTEGTPSVSYELIRGEEE